MEKNMYICLIKAMYRTIQTELLYYINVSRDLREYSSVINSYNPCIANKWTSEGQLKVVWNVNGIKVSHQNKKGVKIC